MVVPHARRAHIASRITSPTRRRSCSAQFHEAPVVYGHSLGALVAVALAAQTPTAVRALVLEDPPSVSLVPRIRETPFFAMFSGMHRLAGDRRSVRETTHDLAEVRIPTGAEGDMSMGDLRDPTSLRFTARALQDVDPAVFPPLLEGRLLEGCDLQAAVPQDRLSDAPVARRRRGWRHVVAAARGADGGGDGRLPQNPKTPCIF